MCATFILTPNSNFSAEIYDGNIDTLHKNCVVQIISGRTTGTFPNVNYTGAFLSVVNNGPNFTSQRIDIITNKNTASYKRSWYYGNDTDYPGWSDWRKAITNSDFSSAVKTTGVSAGKSVSLYVNKLNDTQNYVQFFVDGVDKGYITFDVSRNIK